MAIIIGTDDDDVLEPGPGDDTAFMLDGDDRFIWNPGDGNDIVHGGGGVDTLEFNGSEDVETFTISGDDTGVELLRDVGDIQMTLDGVETIELNALGGDDVIDASQLLASNVSLIVNGGTGDDDAVLGAGDDTFIWNPGDGNDIVDGQDGTDTLLFNGADAVETFTISDTQVLRDVGDIQIDFTTLERIEVNGLGDRDVIDAGDLGESIELVADGGTGRDRMLGGAADDQLSGGTGRDRVFGGEANDEVSGGVGRDRVDGNEGDDLLAGGGGIDRFQLSETEFGDDVIADWAAVDFLALKEVQLADGTAVTTVDQIDTNIDGLLSADDDSFEVVDGDLVLTLLGGSATFAGFDQIDANVEIVEIA